MRFCKLRFVRVGTLDKPDQCPPDVQILTSSKQDWVPLSKDIPILDEFYQFHEVRPQESLDRLGVALA